MKTFSSPELFVDLQSWDHMILIYYTPTVEMRDRINIARNIADQEQPCMVLYDACITLSGEMCNLDV